MTDDNVLWYTGRASKNADTAARLGMALVIVGAIGTAGIGAIATIGADFLRGGVAASKDIVALQATLEAQAARTGDILKRLDELSAKLEGDRRERMSREEVAAKDGALQAQITAIEHRLETVERRQK